MRLAENVIAETYVKSAHASADYYQAHRRAILGESLYRSTEEAYTAATRVASLTPDGEAKRLTTAAERYLGWLRKQGVAEEEIARLVGSRILGQSSRVVLSGGRGALARLMDNDPKVIGYQRQASARCCAFCAMLASRTQLYKSARTAGVGHTSGRRGFVAGVRTANAAPYHNHCRCTAVPVYSRKQRPPKGFDRFERMWESGDIEIKISKSGNPYAVYANKES
jgi:hypothetical protein